MTYGAVHRRASTCVALRPRSCMQNASTYGTVRSVNGLQDHQRRRHVCSNDCPWDHDLASTSFAQRTACWPPCIMQFNDYLMRKTDNKTMRFLVYMYYTHPCYHTSIFGKNCAYYIRIFTVVGPRRSLQFYSNIIGYVHSVKWHHLREVCSALTGTASSGVHVML